MFQSRQEAWAESKRSQQIDNSSEILRPTSEAFVENVKSARVNTSIWTSALTPHPPVVEPVRYG